MWRVGRLLVSAPTKTLSEVQGLDGTIEVDGGFGVVDLGMTDRVFLPSTMEMLSLMLGGSDFVNGSRVYLPCWRYLVLLRECKLAPLINSN